MLLHAFYCKISLMILEFSQKYLIASDDQMSHPLLTLVKLTFPKLPLPNTFRRVKSSKQYFRNRILFCFLGSFGVLSKSLLICMTSFLVSIMLLFSSVFSSIKLLTSPFILISELPFISFFISGFDAGLEALSTDDFNLSGSSAGT